MQSAGFHVDRENHRYFYNGERLPSVTEILGAVGVGPDLSAIPKDVLENARRRGTNVHALTEAFAKGDLDPDVEPDQGLEPYRDAYLMFAREHDYRPLHSELPVYHPILKYAGTADDVGYVDGRLALVDKKAVWAIESKSVAAQLGAYWGAEMAMPGDNPEIQALYALHLKRDGTYKLHQYDVTVCWRAFKAILTTYNWVQRDAWKVAAL